MENKPMTKEEKEKHLKELAECISGWMNDTLKKYNDETGNLSS